MGGADGPANGPFAAAVARLGREPVPRVLHYFAQGAVCYHDLSGTLTPMERLK